MSELNKQEIAAMQKDAAKRVRKMQEIARQKVYESQRVGSVADPVSADKLKRENARTKRAADKSDQTTSSGYQNNKTAPTSTGSKNHNGEEAGLTDFAHEVLTGIEGDRLLILLLIFILHKEEVDSSLILALLYIAV